MKTRHESQGTLGGNILLRRRAHGPGLLFLVLGTVLALLLAGLGLVLASRPGAAAAAPDTVIFTIDGSGSIDPADWTLQREGFSAALRDAAAFPLDGSVAVGVVQWSESTRVEVPVTLIDDPADIDALVTKIQGMAQINSSTNPGDGVRAATDLLASSADPAGRWAVCMSTDGTTNSGEALATAVPYAQSRGVDKYSVAAILDGGIQPSVYTGHYGPFVFGGGSVSVARNTAEFASLIIGSCRNDAVEVRAIEVTQAVQDWENSVPLVAGKQTVVRAFLETSTGQVPTRVNGRLIGRRGGTDLPGSPLAATNPGGSVLAQVDIEGRRGVLADSLNFILPPSWLNGTVELRLDGGGTGLACKDQAGPNADDCQASVTFTPGADAEVRFVAIPYDSGGSTVAPSASAMVEQVARVRSALPVSALTPTTATLFSGYSSVPTTASVNSRLSLQRLLDGCISFFGCDRLYYGVIPGNGDGLASGIPGSVSSGFTDGVDSRTDTGYARNRGTHEIGHTVGVHHAVDGPVQVDNFKHGACGEIADAAAPDFPTFATVGGSRHPVLGPLDRGIEKEAWGLDTRFSRGDVNGLAVSDPRQVFELMGYCKDGVGQQRWPSASTFSGLRAGFESRFGTARAAAVATTAGEHLLVSGRQDRGTGAAVLEPVIEVDGKFPVPDPGTWSVRLFDRAGAVLAEVPFEPIEADGDDGGPSLDTFLVPVPKPAAPIARILISNGSTEVVSQVTTASDPVVSITAPAAGSNHNGATVRLEWTASDPDGGALTSTIRYSTDGGATLTTLAVGLPGTSLEVPRSSLAGGSALIEVIVSDGARSARARSGAFTVAGSGPTVTIASPVNGETFYAGVQLVPLTATATDPEDGDVSASITWISQLDGPVATGANATVAADTLSEGTHVLVASATDAGGSVGSSAVSIMVFRVSPPPPPPPLTTTTTTGGTTSTTVVNDRLCRGLVPTIVGTPGDDKINGTSGADVIVGLAGNDRIRGLGGSDVICGGNGDDRLVGGSGADILSGGDGNDFLAGDAGKDRLIGDDGDDALRGGGGDDELDGRDGTDDCRGGLGTDDLLRCESD